MRYIILFLFIVITSFQVQSINLNYGHPLITSYTEKEYRVSNNNCGIVQDKRGILYFANEYGILEFDGNTWCIISGATNRSNIKSLALDKRNRLYAGAQGDLGFVDHTKTDGLYFHSLLDKIPEEHRDFDDVWRIIIHNDQVIFQTWRALYVYVDDRIAVLKTGKRFKGLFQVQDRVIMHNQDGLYELNDLEFEQIVNADLLPEDEIKFILPFHKNELLVGTQQNGMYRISEQGIEPFRMASADDFKSVRIADGHLRKDGCYVIGTANDGVFVFNAKGEIENHLSRQEGLLNNEIRGLFSDNNNNLWVASKRGIDFVELSTPLRLMTANTEDPIGVYASCMYGNKMIFATHKGLLEIQVDSAVTHLPSVSNFNRIIGTADINWNLDQVNNTLVIGHSKGFSQMDGDEITLLYKGDGGWLVKEFIAKSGYWIGGTYSGLVLFKEVKGQLKFVRKITGFDESSRTIECDEMGNIWVTHGYKGVYRIQLDDGLSRVTTLSFYDQSSGLPSAIYNTVFKVWGEIIFGTQKGFYQYDATNDSMIMHAAFTNLLGEKHGRKLAEDPNGDVWFVAGNKSGILKQHADGSFSVETTPFNKLDEYYIPGFVNYHFVGNDKVLIGTKDGIVIYDGGKPREKSTEIKVWLRRLESMRDSEYLYHDNLPFLCDTLDMDHVELPFKDNSLRFIFSASYYENIQDVRYQIFMQGLDEDWSDWQDVSYKEYTSLQEGDYVFRIRAKNIYDTKSEELAFHFTILSSWYRTKMAYSVYAFLIILLLYFIIKIRNVKAQVEKKRYIEKQERIRKLEQAAFKEEKLQNELESKNKELAAAAMKVIYKNEKVNELKERMVSVKGLASEKVERKLSVLLNFIENELEDDDWEDFALRFDQAHNDFIKNMKHEFPCLTPKDLKLCAYLKMNLSSKEIAQLLNMTVRGVENARYRLRKRMKLDSSVNLTEWLLLRK